MVRLRDIPDGLNLRFRCPFKEKTAIAAGITVAMASPAGIKPVGNIATYIRGPLPG
jgi:hypothetical protein